jgi:hypothetical protein
VDQDIMSILSLKISIVPGRGKSTNLSFTLYFEEICL